MRLRLQPLASGILLVVISLGAATPSDGGATRGRGSVQILDVAGDVAEIGGTANGTVVLLYGVPSLHAATAVRRREIALDGTTVSDTTTLLPEGFAWSGWDPFATIEHVVRTTSIDVDGTAALAGDTEVRLLATDGTFSEPIVPTHPSYWVALRGGFLHLLESESLFQNVYVWEGIRADGTRVGPSAPMNDDRQWNEPNLQAFVRVLDGTSDGSAAIVIETHPGGRVFWLYAVDPDGTLRPMPGEGLVDGYVSRRPRAHAARDGTTWAIEDLWGWGDRLTNVTADDSLQSGNTREVVAAPQFEVGGRTSSGTTAHGRLVVMGPGSLRRDRERLVWASFTAVEGRPPRMRARLLTDAAHGEPVVRFPGERGFAAVAPNGSSLFAAAAAPVGATTPDRVLATLVDPRGRVVRRLEIPAPDFGSRMRDPKVFACGNLGFAVAWQAFPGDDPPPGPVPTKLALVPRR